MAFGSASQVESPRRLERDLISNAAGKGAEKVGFQQSGSSTDRTVLAKLQDITVNAADFGILSSASTSYVAEIQNAIDTLSLSGGANLLFNGPQYLIDSNVTLKDNVNIFGVFGKTNFLLSGNNIRCLQAASLENVIIYGIIFDGQKPNVGWETTNNFDFAIRLGENATGQDVQNVIISHCTFKDIGLDGIYLQACKKIRILTCDFINCRRWGIVPNAGTYNSEFIYIADIYGDFDYGGGPVGKEYPLGLIDSEPNSGTISTLSVKGIRGERNAVYFVGSGTYTYDAVMDDVSVSNEFLYIANNVNAALKNCRIKGANGYLLVDTLNDSVPTIINSNDIDLRFLDTGRNQVTLSDGRENLMPHDYGFEGYFNGSLSVSGSGTSAGLTLREIDGNPVYLRDHQIGPTSGTYNNNRHNIQATITANDQIIMILEVERTDANTATGNFLSVAVGASFSRTLRLDSGVSTLMFAWKASTTEVNPLVSIGLSGTPGAQINMLFRKIKLFVNPKHLNSESFKTKIKPFRKTITSYTGPNASVANCTQVSFSGSASNIDRLTEGYNGQQVSLYGASSGVAFTARDVSVSSAGSDGLELMSNGTYILQNGTSTSALRLTYDSNTTTWVQS